jgi:DNA polymerase zeta
MRLGGAVLRRPLGLLSALSSNIWLSPNGIMFTKHEQRVGVLPRMLKEILETRFFATHSSPFWSNS